MGVFKNVSNYVYMSAVYHVTEKEKSSVCTISIKAYILNLQNLQLAKTCI